MLAKKLKQKYGIDIVVSDRDLYDLNPNAQALWINQINLILIHSTLKRDVSTIGHETIHVIQDYEPSLYGYINCNLYEVIGCKNMNRLKNVLSKRYNFERLNQETQAYAWEAWYKQNPDLALDWLTNLI